MKPISETCNPAACRVVIHFNSETGMHTTVTWERTTAPQNLAQPGARTNNRPFARRPPEKAAIGRRAAPRIYLFIGYKAPAPRVLRPPPEAVC